MVSQKLPILLTCLAAIAGAFGQFFYKKGAAELRLVPIYENWRLFAGVSLFCIVMVLFVSSYRIGGRISVVYPVYATTFVWGILIGIFIEKEPWAPMQSLGLALLILGISLIAISSRGVHV